MPEAASKHHVNAAVFSSFSRPKLENILTERIKSVMWNDFHSAAQKCQQSQGRQQLKSGIWKCFHAAVPRPSEMRQN